jgi:hypothetical protein
MELDHLLGVEVCVYADGTPIGNYTVTADANGTNVIDLGASYDTVIAGINYYSVYESFPLIEQKTGIRRLAMDFYETLGCNVGVSQAQSSNLEFSTDTAGRRSLLSIFGSGNRCLYALEVCTSIWRLLDEHGTISTRTPNRLVQGKRRCRTA